MMKPILLPLKTPLNGGRYRIEKQIGKGDFGITYKAFDTKKKYTVAINEFFLPQFFTREEDGKTVHPGTWDYETFKNYKIAFVAEAKRIAPFRLDGIIYITDVFEDNNTDYVVTRFVEGITLQEQVEKTGPINEKQALNYLRYCALSLEKLHHHDIIHLNITPENIIIHKTGKSVLTGFGVARYQIYGHTEYRMAKLTPYDALEEYTQSHLTHLTDIYSLGAVLFYALTATPPNNPVSRVETPLLPPRHFNKAISEKSSLAIMRAMAMQPENRYQSIRHFLEDILPGGYPKEKKKSSKGFFSDLFGLS